MTKDQTEATLGALQFLLTQAAVQNPDLTQEVNRHRAALAGDPPAAAAPAAEGDNAGANKTSSRFESRTQSRT